MRARGHIGEPAGCCVLALATAFTLSCGTTKPSSSGNASRQSTIEDAPSPASGPASEALVRQVLARATAREGRAAAAAWACWTRRECAPSATDEGARDREVALELLVHPSVDVGAAEQAAARMVLEEAVTDVERAAMDAAMGSLVWDGVAPFVRADLPALLLESDPARRRELLSQLSVLVEEDAVRAAEGSTARTRAGEPANKPGQELLAMRARVSLPTLRAMAEGVLDGTRALVAPLANGPADLPALYAWHAADLDPAAASRGPWLSEVGGSSPRGNAPGVPACFLVDPPEDVRFVPGASPRAVAESRAAASCAAAGRRLRRGAWDPVWVLTVAQLFEQTAWLKAGSARDAAARTRHAQAYVFRVRELAVRVKLLLNRGGAAQRDALATEWASPGAKPLPGAGALLPIDEAGAAADALVAAVVAAAIDGAFTKRFGAGWAGKDDGAVAEQLASLGARWHSGGPTAVLAELGYAQPDASPVVARARALTPGAASPGS